MGRAVPSTLLLLRADRAESYHVVLARLGTPSSLVR